jgi:hypothetical protein
MITPRPPASPDEAAELRLRADVAALCLPDGRMVGSLGHEETRAFLRLRLAETGCVPFAGSDFELPYRHGRQVFFNLAGRLPGRRRGLAPLLLGAHYDSVIPHPCADDNAAAVAIALETARAVATAGGLDRDLLVVLFDAEEPPYFQTPAMGSTRFFEDHLAGRPPHAAVLMDLLGHDVDLVAGLAAAAPGGGLAALFGGVPALARALPDCGNLVVVTGAESHPELAGLLARGGQPPGLRLLPTLNRYIGDVSDHGVFRRNKVPYFFLTCARWEHYHRPTDTPERLNFHKMARTTGFIGALLENLAALPLAQGAAATDTLGLESAFLHDSLGPLLPLALRWAGVAGLGSRQEMDKLVARLMSLGL